MRCRGPSGQAVLTLADGGETTVGALLAALHEKLGVALAAAEVLSGFPPKRLQVRVQE